MRYSMPLATWRTTSLANIRESKRMSKLLYEVIGVPPTATQEEIEAACMRLGQECNPANRPGDLQSAMRFKEVESAYEVLGHPEKRKQYDETLRSPQQAESRELAPPASKSKHFLGSENWSIGQKAGFVLVLLLVAVGIGSSIQGGSSRPEVAGNGAHAGKSGADAKIRELVTDLLKEQAKRSLKDPSSVQFQALQLFHTTMLTKEGQSLPGGVFTLCGEVNAKNSFGGYVGFRRFVSTAMFSSTTGEAYDGTTDVSIEEPDRSGAYFSFPKYAEDMCQDKVSPSK